jgi:hypothetical protein
MPLAPVGQSDRAHRGQGSRARDGIQFQFCSFCVRSDTISAQIWVGFVSIDWKWTYATSITIVSHHGGKQESLPRKEGGVTQGDVQG